MCVCVCTPDIICSELLDIVYVYPGFFSMLPVVTLDMNSLVPVGWVEGLVTSY